MTQVLCYIRLYVYTLYSAIDYTRLERDGDDCIDVSFYFFLFFLCLSVCVCTRLDLSYRSVSHPLLVSLKPQQL